MITKIYDSYIEFASRENKSENGVSVKFAENNPNYAVNNETNESCWDCRGCSDCSDCRGCRDCRGCSDCRDCGNCGDCSDCRNCSDCSYCSDCGGCRGCSYCRGCRGCSDCRDCRGCSDCRGCCGCSYCRDCRDCCNCGDCSYESYVDKGEKTDLAEPVQYDTFAGLKIPIIPNIHQKILDAVKNAKNKLDMSDWHHGNTCGTTHCRAGWVTTLAGDEGKKLEDSSDTCFAAMMIYKYSSPGIRISPNRFFEDNQTAMRDIERCAEMEVNK